MTKLTKTEQEVGDLKGERSRLRSEVKDLQSTIDRFQLELAFLQEDKGKILLIFQAFFPGWGKKSV